MTASIESFYIELYEEHLTELGSLFNFRQDYFFDDNISWTDVYELEQRILVHLDALELKEELVKNCSILYLKSDDEDELSGAIYTLASLQVIGRGLKFVVNAFLGEQDEEKISSFVCGLKFATHPKLTEAMLTSLQHELPIVRAAIIETLGYRGDAGPHRIWPFFHDKDESVKTAAMVAVMRLGFKEAVPAMEQAVLENKETFNEHRVFPLLMLGSKKALEFSRRACRLANYIKPQYPIYLALGGNEEDLAHILKALEFENMNSAVLEALGIFGSLKGVNTLMKFLSSKDDEEKLAAAKSLNQISGAQLYETLTVTEKEDDDINPEEITGKPAANGEEKQPGDERTIEIKQDCTDKERWTQWWQENKANFDVAQRYRHGKPYSLFLCLEEIAHPKTKHEDRQRAYNELVMRSGHHIPFEPDWFVDKQIESLKKWQVWWNENKANLSNQWMFDGV